MTIITSNVIQTIIKLKNSSGPWGPWDNSGNKDNSNKDNNNPPKNNKNNDDDLEAAIKKSQEFIKKLFGQENNRNSNKEANNFNNKKYNFKNYLPKSVFGLIILVLIILWLASGLYKIDSDENGLVLYFGKFYSIATPGLNYHLPAPFGEVIKKSVTTVNTEEFGFKAEDYSPDSAKNSPQKSESLMLTGDENIVDIDFQVQWQISDIKDFVFNIADPNLAIKNASESAMREIIAKTPIADALSDGKKRIEQDAKNLLQQILDSYGAGVRVVLVQMRRVDPPAQVIDAFRDVQTAKADKEKEINQAQSYSNDIIPRARGEASKILEDAEAYRQEVVVNAQGQASRFNAIYKQYALSKSVTKKRMYLENMEKIYKDINKIIIDKNVSKTGAIPYLPINTNNNTNNNSVGSAETSQTNSTTTKP